MPELSSIIGVPTSPISATGIIVNLTIGAILSFILMLHYNHFSHSLSNRAAFSRIFPLIILTTLVVITIVKSSLALSLGLVGALSIVRFRTPIKEPEELAYLFISIAVGLGLGADQKVATIISFIGIIIAATIIHWINLGKDRESVYLAITVEPDEQQRGLVKQITEFVKSRTTSCKIRRVDSRNSVIDLTLYVVCNDEADLSDLLDDINSNWPACAVTLIDQSRVPTI
jgi:hypothetical protein